MRNNLKPSKNSSGVLNTRLDLPEEQDSFTAINQTVIVCKGDVHHWPDDHLEREWVNNRLFVFLSETCLSIFRDRALKGAVHSENSRLRWIDNGRS